MKPHDRKYKVGDKVRVRGDIEYVRDLTSNAMVRLAGQVVCIRYVGMYHGGDRYLIREFEDTMHDRFFPAHLLEPIGDDDV